MKGYRESDTLCVFSPYAPTAVPPAPAYVASNAQPRVNAITWPFHQSNWFSSLWIVLVGWFPLPLPMILSFGWLLDAAGRRAHRDPELLPQARNLLRMYWHGLVFWCALAVYFVAPLMIFSAIFSVEVALINEEVDEWLVGWLANLAIPIANSFIGLFSLKPINLIAQQSFAELFLQEVTRYSTVVVALIIYLIIADSLFLAGTLRFVATGKISAYFRFFKNLGLVIAHFPRFLWLLLLLLLLSLVASIPVVGGLLLLTAGVWITGNLIGNLAAKFRDMKAID